MFYEKSNDYKEVSTGNFANILACGGEIMLMKFKLEKGAIASKHYHVHQQLSYIYSGKVKIIIDNQEAILKSGDSAYIPSNTGHSVKALENSILYDVFIPERKDFLEKLDKPKVK